MCEKGVSYAVETIGVAVISTGAFVGLDALMDSWGADKETVRIASSGMAISLWLVSLFQSLRSSKTRNPVKRDNVLRIE